MPIACKYDCLRKASMRIGDLARRAAVTPRTIRYYERLGLIPAGEREGKGQHRFPESTLLRLTKIDQLKRIGLSLDEVRSVIDLYFTDPSGWQAKSKVRALLRQHLAETDAKLAALTAFRADLQAHVERFDRWLQGTNRSSDS